VLAVLTVLLAPSRADAAVPVLVVDGAGFGHGVGMAQDGAYWMGRAGATTGDILGHFYPGVSLGRSSGVVRVEVLSKDERDLIVTFPNGGEMRSPITGAQSAGFPVSVPPGGAVRIRFDGTYHVTPAGAVHAQSASAPLLLPIPTTTTPPRSTTTTTAPAVPVHPTTSTTGPPTTSTTSTTSPTSAERTSPTSVWAVPANGGTVGVPDRGARYRGAVEANASGGPLRLIDQLDVEDYLRGMGEVRDPSWPAASLRAQATVARTYALRAMRASGEICDTERCQVYLGQQAEYPAMDRAVADTAGQVLLYHGAYAAAVYSANGAGVSASPNEGFGTPDDAYPYLRAAAYETHSPDPWQVRIALQDLASRVHYRGALSAVTVAATGASGRPTVVALDGSAGATTIAATDLDHALGLRSTKWTVRLETGEPPAPPPVADAIQSLPDVSTTPPVAAAHAERATVALTPPLANHHGRTPVLPAAVTILLGTACSVVVRRSPDEPDPAD